MVLICAYSYNATLNLAVGRSDEKDLDLSISVSNGLKGLSNREVDFKVFNIFAYDGTSQTLLDVNPLSPSYLSKFSYSIA